MAKDVYHQVVREALEKDGWAITHDPYFINRTSQNKPYEVDLGAERMIAAQKDKEYIAIEIKSFLGSSITYDFHAAFGQYNIYRYFIDKKEAERRLYLAITEEIYLNFFEDEDIQQICNSFKINLLVFDSNLKIITSWIER